ncbi:MAG TPA: response regulator transcription factor [Cyclobacteriaceae bacterium]|jgi:two-component system nitrate/nitrite response regulator NarL|nr:response regulator transcription factor [Cyclobacteriaceae bacterium]
MIRIVVIDDHALFRIGLIAILNKNPHFNVVGEYKSFSAFKPVMSDVKADLALIDISLEKESGFDAINCIRKLNPDIRIVILSSHKEEFYIVNALEADIDGYIHKNAEPSELIMGLEKVLEGEKFYSLEISNILVGSLYKKNYRGLPSLTSKEKEIIKNLMNGNSSKEIAAMLNVSPRTVETHRANILGKFGLKNTTELVTRISEHKIKF